MKVTLTITDTRVVFPNGAAFGRADSGKQEDYERVTIADASMNPQTLAGLLRTIADDVAAVRRDG